MCLLISSRFCVPVGDFLLQIDCIEVLFWLKQFVGLVCGCLLGLLTRSGLIYLCLFLLLQSLAAFLWAKKANALGIVMDFTTTTTEATVPAIGIFIVSL